MTFHKQPLEKKLLEEKLKRDTELFLEKGGKIYRAASTEGDPDRLHQWHFFLLPGSTRNSPAGGGACNTRTVSTEPQEE